MKTLVTLFLIIVFSLSTYSQSVKDLEYALSWYKSGEKYGDKIDTARILQKVDPFNEIAIQYICNYYNDRHIDSVSVFFDKLIKDHPGKTEPFILRAVLLNFEIQNYWGRNFTIKKAEYLKKALKFDHNNIMANYYLAALYYTDFLKPFKKESDFGPLMSNIKNNLETLKKSHFSHSADSALFYFKRLEAVSSKLRQIVYFPIKQLEHYLNNTTKAVKLDPLMGISDNCFFPIWYFANLSSNWANDISVDYLSQIESSKLNTEEIKEQLENLEEPCLYSMKITENNEIFRFTWLRSFHPPISIRIEKKGDLVELYWKQGKGSGGYAPEGIELSGDRKISISDWYHFIDNFKKVGFDALPNNTYVPMFEGASWIMEMKTYKSFKAHKTNEPSKNFKNSCLLLLNLTGIKIKQEDIY